MEELKKLHVHDQSSGIESEGWRVDSRHHEWKQEMRIVPPSFQLASCIDGLWKFESNALGPPGTPHLPSVAWECKVPSGMKGFRCRLIAVEESDLQLFGKPEMIPKPEFKMGADRNAATPNGSEMNLVTCDPDPHTRYPHRDQSLITIRVQVAVLLKNPARIGFLKSIRLLLRAEADQEPVFYPFTSRAQSGPDDSIIALDWKA